MAAMHKRQLDSGVEEGLIGGCTAHLEQESSPKKGGEKWVLLISRDRKGGSGSWPGRASKPQRSCFSPLPATWPASCYPIPLESVMILGRK